MIRTTAPITIAGITREAEITYHLDAPAGAWIRGYVAGAVARIGRGDARYPAQIALALINDTSRAHIHPRAARTTAADGTEWCYDMAATVRNRQATIIAWETEAARTNDADQTRR